MKTPGLTAAALAALIACGQGPPAPSTAPTHAVARPALAAAPPRGVVSCVLEGTFPIAAGEKLLLGDAGNIEMRFTGHPVGVRVTSLDVRAASAATVKVRAAASPPSLLLDGKLRGDILPLRAARDIPIAARTSSSRADRLSSSRAATATSSGCTPVTATSAQ